MRAILEDGKDDPQELAGDDDQRLHLLQGVAFARCVIRVDLLEFRRMRRHGFGCLEQPVPQPLPPAMADLGFALVFAGAAGDEAHAAHLLDFLGRVETGEVSHLRDDAGEDGSADARDFQEVFRMRELHASGMQLLSNLLQFFVQHGNLPSEVDDRFPRGIHAVLQADALLRVTDDFLGSAVAASAQFRRMPEAADAVCADGFQVCRKRRDLKECHGERTVHFPERVLIFREVDGELAMEAVHGTGAVFHELVTEQRVAADVCVVAFRKIGHAVVAIFDQVGDELRVFEVVLPLAVVFEFLRLLDGIGVDLDDADPVRHQPCGQAEPVVAGRFEADDDLRLPVAGRQFQKPGFHRSKSFGVIVEGKGFGTEFAPARVNGAEVMRLAADVATGHQHVVADEADLVVLGKLPMGFEILPRRGPESLADLLSLLDKFLALENVFRNDLIFLRCCFSIHGAYLV